MSLLLEVSDLSTHFETSRGNIKAVDRISFSVRKGEIHGLVGESGSGKSATALSIMRLVPSPPGRIVSGRVVYQGTDLLSLPEKEMKNYRGGEIAMIFQDPLSSLNPLIRIGDQIAEVAVAHKNLDKKQARMSAMKLLELVGISDAETRARQYPFELSGGMRQRVMIAIALAGEPSLLIADEPTTNLDVTIQAQIFELMGKIRNELGTSILLITHNLGLIAWLCERVEIMYSGELVESAETVDLFSHHFHPYTEALLHAVPDIQVDSDRLLAIQGSVPNPLNLPSGCRFHPRCVYAKEICKSEYPELQHVDPEHSVRCLKYKYPNW
ncbi:MAG TPA: ABC transporter ATP-binding protein [Nitrososphaerales archaeon]|nr:ABC transporter ATP-binding protein [Nitrososphaerales archaeon]